MAGPVDTWARAFLQWLDPLETALRAARDRARDRGDAPRVAELTNSLERIPSIRGAFDDAPAGAKLAMLVLDLTLTQSRRDIERGLTLSRRDIERAARVARNVTKASTVAKVKRDRRLARRDKKIRALAAKLDPALKITPKAIIVRKKLGKHPPSLRTIRRVLGPAKK